MKLFQQLLLAPAALGLLAPVAATAAEVNINDVASYARKPVSQMRAAKATQFSDVVPGDWAYTALLNLSESYGCVDSAYTQNLKSGQSLTRYEAAALVNSCLQGGVSDAGNSDVLRLTNEFGTEMAILKGRSNGLEYKVQELSAGQFSPTTKLDSKVVFNLGYVTDELADTGNTVNQKVNSTYVFQTNVNTSFTGEDRLYTRLKTGNVVKTAAQTDPFEATSTGTHLVAANDSDNAVTVDKIWYEWPVSDSVKAWFGPKIENYYMLASAPAIYKPVTKQFALGGNAAVYGSSTSPGFGVAWTQQKDSRMDARWEVSTNYATSGGNSATTGLLTDRQSKWLSKVGYGSPRWQVSLAMAKNLCYDADKSDNTDAESCKSWNSYYSTAAANGSNHAGNQTAYALRGYWQPEETGLIPAVQLGYDFSNIDHNSIRGEVKETAGWMAGFMWKDAFRDGNRAGIAFGVPEHVTEYVEDLAVGGPHHDPANKAFAWEAYYDYKVNDGITITPSIFGFKNRTNGLTDANDGFGGLVQTTFKF